MSLRLSCTLSCCAHEKKRLREARWRILGLSTQLVKRHGAGRIYTGRSTFTQVSAECRRTWRESLDAGRKSWDARGAGGADAGGADAGGAARGGCQGVTPNVTPGKAGAVPGGRRRARGIRTPGADRVGGQPGESKRLRGRTRAWDGAKRQASGSHARCATRSCEQRRESATERSGAQGSWRSICGFHADRCKFVRFCTRSGSDNPSLALCEGTRPGVMRKRYHAERN